MEDSLCAPVPVWRPKTFDWWGSPKNRHGEWDIGILNILPTGSRVCWISQPSSSKSIEQPFKRLSTMFNLYFYSGCAPCIVLLSLSSHYKCLFYKFLKILSKCQIKCPTAVLNLLKPKPKTKSVKIHSVYSFVGWTIGPYKVPIICQLSLQNCLTENFLLSDLNITIILIIFKTVMTLLISMT